MVHFLSHSRGLVKKYTWDLVSDDSTWLWQITMFDRQSGTSCIINVPVSIANCQITAARKLRQSLPVQCTCAVTSLVREMDISTTIHGMQDPGVGR